MQIDIVQKVMKLNDDIAQKVRARLHAAGVLSLNLISAPGSGKTTLIERTLAAREQGLRAAIIEGDPETARDAERIAPYGVPVVQITTSGACHLEANLVSDALDRFDLSQLDLLIIENVGNLVCPVEFDLGETKRVALVSTAEGHDKPAKYPKLFRQADLVVLNKIDLLPHVEFDMQIFEQDVHRLQPGMPVLKLSCQTGEGLDAWLQWLHHAVDEIAHA